MRSIPIPTSGCYACDKRAVGVTRRYVTGTSYIEAACKRHADPAIKSHTACIYCGEPVRAGAIAVDDMYAHQTCIREFEEKD